MHRFYNVVIEMQHIHILGICGTFMGSLAQLAKAKGYRVTGCDVNVYPPMSTQLELAGIELISGFDLSQLTLKPDLFVIGNAMSRGNPLVEAILDQGLTYTSGPQWLHDHLLPNQWVLSVSGTHGKTTTASMLAWILEYAGMSPSFLIGGVPGNFSVSARLGKTAFFVIEADEYDSAFFDKRSKFVHYQGRTVILNNLEFDHADIFDDLAAIQKQFHHMVRTIPHQGLVIYPQGHEAIEELLALGCWTPQHTLSLYNHTADWVVQDMAEDGSQFSFRFRDQAVVKVEWSLLGQHNVNNALAAIAAAHHVGVTEEVAAQALQQFVGVKRRMEVLWTSPEVTVYDDFAHHPTAIASTLAGLRAKVGSDTILALIEPRSNTMRMGVHQGQLAQACEPADAVLWLSPKDIPWDIDEMIAASPVPAESCATILIMVERAVILAQAQNKPVHIVIMSNGGFGGVHQQLIKQLQENE